MNFILMEQKVEQHHNRSGLVLGICNKTGFTLVEILVAIALIAVMATIVVPNLRPRDPALERRQFITRFNGLLRIAQHDAMVFNKTHKIFVDLEKNVVQLQTETEKRDDKGEAIFAPTKGGGYLSTTFKWPKNLRARNFYIENFDEMERFSGQSTGQAWFFIVPNGTAQQVILNIEDTKDRRDNRPKPFSLVLNPFSAQFKEYDTFQKP